MLRAAGGLNKWSSRHWWLVLAVVLALGCIWELFGLENRLGGLARALARAEHYYHARALVQKAIISVTIAATVVFLGFLRGRRTLHWPLVLFTGLYLALSVVNLLSFHSLDQYAGLSWHGITLVEAMKCACAVAILKAVLQAHKLAP
jgi:hypothetical protein